jgi:hypothetical protein
MCGPQGSKNEVWYGDREVFKMILTCPVDEDLGEIHFAFLMIQDRRKTAIRAVVAMAAKDHGCSW